jgi:hypothetical protein
MKRVFHPPRLGRNREREQFDPVNEGDRYGLSRELLLAIWTRVRVDASDIPGRHDEGQLRQRFHDLAARIAACDGRSLSEVGRITRVGVELDGATVPVSWVDKLRPRTPGRETLVAVEARRSALIYGEPAVDIEDAKGFEGTDEARKGRDLPGVGDVKRAMAALQPRAWPDRGTRQNTFDDFRSRGLHDVLAALTSLRGERGLMEATVSAARSRGQRVPSLTLRPAPLEQAGQAMWRAAERRAVTLYRRAVDSDDLKIEESTVEEALARAGGGQPLPAAVRHMMEIELGVSLDRVRIHTDLVAADAAHAVRAKAFTVGDDIFFADGAYAPNTPVGQRLLAHELAHVVQAYQGRVTTGGVGIRVSSPGEALEREADAIADRIGAQRSDYPDQPGSKSRSQGSMPTSTSKQALAPSMPSRWIAKAASGTLILRQAEPTKPLSGQPVQRHGIAYKPEGVNLREQASTNGRVLQQLAFNTRVFVDSQEGSWYFVTTSDGKFGYCADTHIKVNLPEPDAKIHWIKPGETALSISQKYYGGKAEWGNDHRFYVNGLVYTNLGKGQRGIFKPDANAGWDTTKVLADYMIWVPSLNFMKSLHGKISSGSITAEAWQSVKTAAEAVGEFLLGAGAFIAGVLHGALESLWDVLVGLKDLAVMIWDILKSVFTGNLLSDAAGLWNDLSNLDWKKLVTGWINEFDAKWNDDSVLKRWHFRGWVTGYVVMEVLMLFFSAGVIQGIKWVGKASKVTKVLQKLPRLQKLAEMVKAGKAYQKVEKALAKGGEIASKPADAIKWIERLLVEPKAIWGKGPDEIAEVFRKAGHEVVVEQSKKGSKLSQQIRIKGGDINNIQVHPGGGRHGGAYYKISSSTKGVIKVVDKATYVATQGEKATIIFMSGPEGWLLQAAAANSAAQNAGQEIGEQMDTQDE